MILFLLQDIMFKRLGRKAKVNDSYKDDQGRGIWERYFLALAQDFDVNFWPLVENFLDNTIVPDTVMDRFIAYLEEQLGNDVKLYDDIDKRRRLLAFIIRLYQVKGTARSYEILLKTMGFDGVVIEEHTGASTLDSDVTLDDVFRTLDSAESGSTEYSLYLTGSFTLTQDDRTRIRKIVKFCEPITASLRDIFYNENPINIGDGPQILSVVFGDFPGTQTELKTGDTIEATVTFAYSQYDIERIYVEGGGMFVAKFYDIPQGAGQQIVITLEVEHDHSGIAADDLTAWLYGVDIVGNTGQSFETPALSCNNLAPVIALDSLAYPNTQLAIKSGEAAEIGLSISNYDTVLYSSPTGELVIPDNTVFESIKTVNYNAGGYNIDTPNFRVVATRAANGAQAIFQAVVAIADASPAIDIIADDVMRSGGNAGSQVQEYELQLVSDQELLLPPEITAPAGTLVGGMVVDPEDSLLFTQAIQISDNDSRGGHVFTLVQATNLAGKVVFVIDSGAGYTIAGAVARQITIPGGDLVADIGFTVVNPANLVASIDDPPSEINYVAPAQVDDDEFNFTIVNGSDIQLSAGIFEFNANRDKVITIEEQ